MSDIARFYLRQIRHRLKHSTTGYTPDRLPPMAHTVREYQRKHRKRLPGPVSCSRCHWARSDVEDTNDTPNNPAIDCEGYLPVRPLPPLQKKQQSSNSKNGLVSLSEELEF